jgi:nondiscriminating aspartyl-tRNA synthetase
MHTLPRSFISNLQNHLGHEVKTRGWIFRIRELAKTTFILVKDCTGIVQCVGSTDILHASRLREEDAIEIHGSIREETRAHGGFELDILAVVVLNPAKEKLPFHSASDLSSVSLEILLDHRPLALRNERIGDIFRIHGAILRYFREFLIAHQFTEIISSKIVAGGTEGGTNLFAIRYFDRVAYLAQSQHHDMMLLTRSRSALPVFRHHLGVL